MCQSYEQHEDVGFPCNHLIMYTQVEKEREKVEEKNTSAPTVMQIEAAGSSKRCTVIYENAPQASSIGRFKFSARSPAEAEAEASAAELEKKKAKASAKLKDEVEELTVSDADLAKAFRRGPAARTSEDDAAGVRRKKQRAN